jgi:hypothetical protein
MEMVVVEVMVAEVEVVVVMSLIQEVETCMARRSIIRRWCKKIPATLCF